MQGGVPPNATNNASTAMGRSIDPIASRINGLAGDCWLRLGDKFREAVDELWRAAARLFTHIEPVAC